jgi:hypothetical protein
MEGKGPASQSNRGEERRSIWWEEGAGRDLAAAVGEGGARSGLATTSAAAAGEEGEGCDR